MFSQVDSLVQSQQRFGHGGVNLSEDGEGCRKSAGAQRSEVALLERVDYTCTCMVGVTAHDMQTTSAGSSHVVSCRNMSYKYDSH